MTFSAGPRACIGYCLAVLEFKVRVDKETLIAEQLLTIDQRLHWRRVFVGFTSVRLVILFVPGMWVPSNRMWLAKKRKDSSFR